MSHFRPFTDMWGWKAYGLALFNAAMEQDARSRAAQLGWRRRKERLRREGPVVRPGQFVGIAMTGPWR